MSSRLAATLNKGPRVQNIAISLIDVPPSRAREFNPDAIADLAVSINAIGLLHPITVRLKGQDPLKPRYELISGLHRLRAFERLGRTEIAATLTTLDDTRRALAELDENLQRSTLSVLEQSEHLHARDKLLDELGLRAQTGGQGADSAPLTTQELAKGMGISKRVYQENMQVGRLPRRIRDKIRGTPLEDRKTDLLHLSRVRDEGEQMAIVERVLEGLATSVKDAQAQLAQPDYPPKAINVEVLSEPFGQSPRAFSVKILEPVNLSGWSGAADQAEAGQVVITPLPRAAHLVDACAYFAQTNPVGLAQGYVRDEDQQLWVVWSNVDLGELPAQIKDAQALKKLLEQEALDA